MIKKIGINAHGFHNTPLCSSRHTDTGRRRRSVSPENTSHHSGTGWGCTARPLDNGEKKRKKWVKSGHGEDQNEAGVQHMSIFPGDFCSGFACEKGSLKAWLWWIIRWESWANQALNVCMGVEESCWFTWCEITDPKRMIKFENNIFACNTLTCILSSKSSFKMKITVT